MYALTIFLGAFLVFQVQPLVGKYILPWFGGSPGVWTTCLLFFQVMLLVGYSYAHLVVLRLSGRAQGIVHGLFLLATLALLPITPNEAWKAAEMQDPTWRILALLAVTVGGPYVLLSSTAPLVQSWFARKYVGRSPYRLYALSNVGALLALLTYPLIYEPWFRLNVQAWMWSATYVAFAAACGACAWQVWRGDTKETPPEELEAQEEPLDVANTATAKTKPLDILLWLCLAAMGTVMLMATTNHMCQDVASVPFLWVLPLALYLLTFIIAFDHERWYHRGFWSLPLIVSVVGVTLMISNFSMDLFGTKLSFGMLHSIGWQVGLLSFAMFSCVMCCHGELVKLRPPTQNLTLFYLIISAGGALGGIFVAVIAPLVFDSYAELHIGLMGSCVAVIVARRWAKARESGTEKPVRWGRLAMGAVVGVGVFAVLRYQVAPLLQPEVANIIETDRNFYGVLMVKRELKHDGVENPAYERLIMSHGTTIHGCQFLQQPLRSEPTMYYSRKSGIGLAIANHPRRTQGDGQLRIGVVGLGVGTLAAYARDGDDVCMYEINPTVVRMAREHFSYLDTAEQRGANVRVLLGDARIVMEQQLADGQPQQFDVLAIDAFSSDAIPMHLLTRECFEIYRKHLAPGGVLAVHASNLHLDLAPVIRGLAADSGELAASIEYIPSSNDKLRNPKVSKCHWILVTQNEAFLQSKPIRHATVPWSDDSNLLLWTDDFSSLLQVLW
jgi:hypothetical protein